MKKIEKYIDVILNPFYLIFISFSGVIVAFWAVVFFIGSHETMQNLIIEDGAVCLTFKRFLGFSFLGILLSLGIALISVFVQLFSKKKDYTEPLRVFVVSSIYKVFCALIGSVIFFYRML